MKLAIVTTAVLALVYARPETYRENEEFQYSRSSSDDGSKSGFYGAQRGNMGGNYEKAHNMDSLAQHQMSSVVSQVDGELGSGADTKTGSVYTAGSSRGVYGSGKYDLSNLRGRNFAEGTSYGNSQSSAFSQNSGYHGESYSAANNARYRNRQSQLTSQNLGYRGTGETFFLANQQEDDLQQISNQDYINQAANNYKYHSQASSHGSSSYDQSVTDSRVASGSSAATGSNTFSGTSGSTGYRRYTSPIRVYVRPGTRTSVPVSVHAYDASQYDSSHALTEQNQENFAASGVNTRPKHYESSYSYKKEWEKHDTQPLAVIPTENPFPKHSELYDTAQNLQQISQSSGSAYQGYSSNAKYSNSHKSAFQSDYKDEGQHLASASNLQAYTADNHATKNAGEVSNLVGDLDSKPKSYQSSYSYHKSWERRGDPYVIIPADNGQAAQRLTAASDRYGQRSTHQHGSRYNYAQQGYSEDCDCDENGQIRVARSIDESDYQNVQQQSQDLFDLGQQQQTEWSNSEDLGQQTQNKWENFEGLELASPNKFDQLESLPNQYTHNQNLEDLGQQTQNQWDNLADLGQQTQNKWDNLESLSQQQQNYVDNLAILGQEAQNKWDNTENLGQQTQSQWDNLESLNQQQEKKDDIVAANLDQQTQYKREHLEDLGQQSENKWDNIESLSQQQQNKVGDLKELGQQTQDKWDQVEDLSQQTQNTWDQNTQVNWNFENTNLHSQQDWKQQEGNTYHQHQFMLNNIQNSHNLNQNQQNYNLWGIPSTPHRYTGTTVREQNTRGNNGYTNFWHAFEQGNDWDLRNNPESFNQMSHIQHDLHNTTPKNTDGSSLNNLWNKIDYIAGIDSIAGNVQEQSHSTSNAQVLNEHWSDQHGTNFWDIIEDENAAHTKYKHEIVANVEAKTYNQEDVKLQNNTSYLQEPEEAPMEQNIHSVDLGRGDIDSEDISTAPKEDIDLDKLFEINRNKSSPEIESLSQKKVNNDDSKELSSTNSMNLFGVLDKHESAYNSYTQKQTNTHTNSVKITTTSTEKYTDLNYNNLELKPSTLTLAPQSEVRVRNVKPENLYQETQTDENLEQQFIKSPLEDFGQISEDQSLVNFDQNVQDTQQLQQFEQINTFGIDNEEQQNQNLDSFPSNNNFETQKNKNEHVLQVNWDSVDNNDQQLIVPSVPQEKSQKVTDLESVIKPDDEIIVPIEVTTVKPGFWKSIGYKLNNAKESVVSWFSS